MLNKIKEFLKENRWIIITFLLSSIAISIIYILKKIAPFGNNSMLDVDFYHQYGPLLNELYDRVKSGESILYSFNTGAGIPFFRNFFNYLSSPFNLILFLFKKENIVMAFSIIIALKVIISSVTMSYFLKNSFKNNNFLISIFSLLYVFSGYFCAYYWNIMWLDRMVFLPLIIYGINKIVDDKNPFFFIISLSIMLFANYFIAYMICIFCVLYFLGYFWYKNKFNIKSFIKTCLCFIISSILSASLVSFALIPVYNSLASISATTGSFPALTASFNIIDFLFNHLTGVERTVFSSDTLPLPNVYSGLISIVLVLSIFLNKKINRRFKIITILFFFVFLASFSITSLDFIWHAFHVPNDLPWRYSFIYVFCFISLAYYAALKFKHLGFFKISFLFSALILFILLSLKFEFKNINNEVAIICILVSLLYYLLYVLLKSEIINKKFLKLSFIIVVMFECIYGINTNWNIDHDIKTFMSDKEDYKKLINEARKDDNGLYRIEKTSYLTLNDGAWYDYYGISTFSSMAYEDVAKNQRMLGMAGNNINSYYYQNFQTPIYNTMFNIKYILGNYIENDYYSFIDSEDTYNLTLYNYNSSLLYTTNKDLKNWNLINYEPFLNQSNFAFLATGVNDIFEPVNVSEVKNGEILSNSFYSNSNGDFAYKLNSPSKELELIIDNFKARNIYFYIGGSKVNNFSINGSYYSLTSDEYYILDAGKLPKGEVNIKINFKDSEGGSLKFYAYAINDEKFKNFYNNLSSGFLNVKKYNETYIKGNIKAKQNQIVFSTIAYDEGWQVYVDDKRVNTYKLANAYLGFDIEEGEHKIVLKYYPKGMKIGLIISFISLIIINIYWYIFNKISIKKQKNIINN